jgi:hypothetical protein
MNKKIETIGDFFDFLKNNSLQTRKRIFRGLQSINYELITGIGRVKRAELNTNFDVNAETRMLNAFKQKGYSYLKSEFSTMELLTLAQHHGLPTRLLDWTWNPLVAAFFAVKYSEKNSDDGVIYFADTGSFGFEKIDSDPFAIKDLMLYDPIHVTSRISNQAALFLIHPNPNEPIIDTRIGKVVIAKGIKNDIEILLETMGIHNGSLFPGLDGIASYVEWLYTSY